MTGNGIESDFVLPDSLFISDYSTLPSSYPHFGANCRFFCTISMSPDSSALFCSPNAARGAASGLRQRVFDPLDSRSRDWVGDNCIQCPRVYGGTQGALPLDSAKGSSTLWTPVRAIQLSAFSRYARVLIGGNPRGAAPGPRQRVFDPLDSRSRDCVGDALMPCPRADPVSKRAAPACRDSPSNRQYSFQQEHLLELRMPADFSVPSFPARWHRGGAYIPPASPA